MPPKVVFKMDLLEVELGQGLMKKLYPVENRSRCCLGSLIESEADVIRLAIFKRCPG